ncbi:hypothetical protein P9597_19270 [Aneurinibacillus migulanus]|uniref:hypothetical protein n=1 Tax=Aneurinibacillus migulanus TaxID=47500 RepID=UPI002E1E7E5D|nr:hypothetical protein [Aneurinibacillus migulanus]
MERKWEGLPIVIFGIGGAAKEVKWLVDDINNASSTPLFKLLGFVSNSKEDIGMKIDGAEVITYHENFHIFSSQFRCLGIVIGLGNPKWKLNIEEEVLSRCDNLFYPNLIHPRANISRDSCNDFGVGNIICAGVTITKAVKLGKFIILNRNSTIGHDTVIDDYCTINPLAVISGNVHIEELCLIGAGASILEKTRIKKASIVGLGAIIVRDIEENSVMICKAAHKLEK